MTLTATKLFGFRSSDGVCSSLQAVESRWVRNESFKIKAPGKSPFQTHPKQAKNVNDALVTLSAVTGR